MRKVAVMLIHYAMVKAEADYRRERLSRLYQRGTRDAARATDSKPKHRIPLGFLRGRSAGASVRRLAERLNMGHVPFGVRRNAGVVKKRAAGDFLAKE